MSKYTYKLGYPENVSLIFGNFPIFCFLTFIIFVTTS